MFLYLLTFLVVFGVSAFGATYLLLRRTPYAPYSVLLSLIFFQPILLICITLFGYRMPQPLPSWSVFVVIAAGTLLSVFVSLRYRVEILESLRSAWKTSVMIFGLATASILLATPILVGSTSLSFIDWWNGEMVNYSLYALHFLGMLRDPNYLAFCEAGASVRYGAELFLAVLSVITGKAPLLLVEVLSALYKFSAIVAFAVSFELIRQERRMKPAAVILADIGFAFSAILSLNHVLAFLAAQATTASGILISLALFSQGIKTRGVQIFLALQVLFIVITYAEALPFLVAAYGVVLIEAMLTRRKDLARALLLAFGIGLLLNPILLISRLGYMYRLSSAIAGFNVLGDPRTGLASYLAQALGFHYVFSNKPPLPFALSAIAILLALTAILYAFFLAAFRFRTLLFIGIPLVLIVVHLGLLPDVQPPTTMYYKGYKTIAALYFYIFIAVGCLMDRLIRRWPQSWPFPFARAVLFAGIGALVLGNIFVTMQAASAIKSVPSVYHETDFNRVLRPGTSGDSPLLVLADDNSAAIWDVMETYMRTKRVLLDVKQAATIYHNPGAVLIEPAAFSAGSSNPTGPGPSALYTGRIVIPTIAAYSPSPQPFSVQTTLQAIAPGARLRESQTIFDTTAFRLIDGSLLSTSDVKASADGTTNLPPSIVGLNPVQGQGDSGTLNFTYSDPNGFADVLAALVQVYSEKKPIQNACYLSFAMGPKQLGLVLDGGKTWDTTMLGSSKNLENVNCGVDAAHSFTTSSGNSITLHLAMKFKPAFNGRKVVETTVVDQGKLTTGWKPVGWWTVP